MLLKDKKYNYVPDMIVIEGPEAGGHLGFKPEELEEGKKLFINIKLSCLLFFSSYTII